MELSLKLDIPPLKNPVTYQDTILLIGSCFTEHIADRLRQHKFKLVSNPNGILFNPLSVAQCLENYVAGRQYNAGDLFYLNELWNSWDHHTRFSDMDVTVALENINREQNEAASAIRDAGWIIITLGSAFQYYLKDGDIPVANNHRAPSQWFEKKLLSIEAIVAAMGNALKRVADANPDAQILFTISPVRHIRDGVVDNNRSKARLIEAVHQLCAHFPQANYFPAYELVIDILRDYRFYDIDFVHPNFLATNYVWEQFTAACIDVQSAAIMAEVNEIVTAARHRPRFSDTSAHKKFKLSMMQKVAVLAGKYPFLNWEEELKAFVS